MQQTNKLVLVLTSLTIFFSFFANVSSAKQSFDADMAVTTARRYIIETYDVTLEFLENYKLAECSFRSYETSNGEGEWLVIFAGDSNDSTYDTNTYAIYMNHLGVVMRSFEPTLTNELNEAFMELIKERGMFVTWTLQQKYDFSHEWESRKQTSMHQQNNNKAGIIGYLQYLMGKNYLLPNSSDISKEEATFLSDKEIIHLLGSTNDLAASYSTSHSFLEVNGLRAWRIFYIPLNRSNTDCGYRVDINSQTGNIMEILHQVADEQEWATYYE